MSSKKRHKGAIKQNENTDVQPKSQLFSEVDAKSVKVSGYTLGHGAPQVNELIHEHSIPTGVVDIDDTVVLPAPSSNSSDQHSSESNTIIQSSQIHNREHVRLPPIIHRSHQHYPYEYFYAQPNYHHSEHSYRFQPIHHEHQSFHHHHHHHRHHHHKHGETYDPRWWYMPLGSVHGPKPRLPIDHHYTPPKWYELPSKQ